jgi:hypothetical protein
MDVGKGREHGAEALPTNCQKAADYWVIASK